MGKVIAIIGIDGSGKSTVLKNLPYPNIHFYKRNTLFKVRESYTQLKNRKTRNLKIFIGTLIKYYFPNLFIFFYYKFLTKQVFIFDRYSFDFHGRRTPINRNLSKVLSYLFRIFPKPDYIVFLDIAPRIAFERKKEHSMEYLIRKRGLLKEALESVSSNKIITLTTQQEIDHFINYGVTRLIHKK